MKTNKHSGDNRKCGCHATSGNLNIPLIQVKEHFLSPFSPQLSPSPFPFLSSLLFACSSPSYFNPFQSFSPFPSLAFLLYFSPFLSIPFPSSLISPLIYPSPSLLSLLLPFPSLIFLLLPISSPSPPLTIVFFIYEYLSPCARANPPNPTQPNPLGTLFSPRLQSPEDYKSLLITSILPPCRTMPNMRRSNNSS